ncbi:hypothetical protein BD410DRAFT_845608 [Rickenella mellea]|uniref:Uncharacterized protein n=1 Tax=Rickenella mellea TaxID=50990 RepID=A0A4Y7PIR3_9AGAM|nr:hypothetical protein BD410DRAFT_845608 [Rickenella mellea]
MANIIAELLKEHGKLPCFPATVSLLAKIALNRSNQEIAEMRERLWEVYRYDYLNVFQMIALKCAPSTQSNTLTRVDFSKLTKAAATSHVSVNMKVETFTMTDQQKPLGKALKHCCLNVTFVTQDKASVTFLLHPCNGGMYEMGGEPATKFSMVHGEGIQITDPTSHEEFSSECIGSLAKLLAQYQLQICQVSMINVLQEIEKITVGKAKMNGNIDKAIDFVRNLNREFQVDLYNLKGGNLAVAVPKTAVKRPIPPPISTVVRN